MNFDELRSRMDIQDAEAELPKLVGRAEHGEEILICRASAPAAKLAPLPVDFDTRLEVAWEGEIQLAEGLETLRYASAEV